MKYLPHVTTRVLKSPWIVLFFMFSIATFSFSTPPQAQSENGPNVVDFLEAVGRLCGGQVREVISVEGDNISFRTTEVTVDPGTGNLKIERDGILIAEQSGEFSSSYYECVEKLTEALGGAFASPPLADPSTEVGYEEPTRDEMLRAHKEQVAVGALFMQIDHFEKAGCKLSSGVGYDCSYSIRAGGFGAPSFVTNTFAKVGDRWIMYWR